MSKYVIDIPKTVGMLEKVGSVHYMYFDGIQVQTIVLKSDEIEELNSDYINEHYGSLQDEAYQRGLEDGKAQSERGCDGCRFDGTRCTACENCCNSHMNHWTAKDDEIKVGDEVRAEDGTAVFVVTWVSENCICGVDREGKCYSYEPREVCGKTGRRYDISFSDIARGEDDEN